MCADLKLYAECLWRCLVMPLFLVSVRECCDFLWALVDLRTVWPTVRVVQKRAVWRESGLVIVVLCNNFFSVGYTLDTYQDLQSAIVGNEKYVGGFSE